jgi:hypothetical protein
LAVVINDASDELSLDAGAAGDSRLGRAGTSAGGSMDLDCD